MSLYANRKDNGDKTNGRLLNVLVVLLVRHCERLHDSNGSV